MMKKNFKKTMALLLASCALTSTMVACGPRGHGIDSHTIVFTVFNGGWGSAWAERAVNEWNSANAESTGYRIELNPNKDEWFTHQANLEAGTAIDDIYFSNADYKWAYAKNAFEDLTDVWNSTPTGESKTVMTKLKTNEKEFVDLIFKNPNDNKYYGLPLATGLQGFIYDHDIFLQKGYLIADEKTPDGKSKLITDPAQKLSAGRDKEYGTFDDGHPLNMEEYNLMINAIAATSNMYAYLWGGSYDYYFDSLNTTMIGDYDGYEALLGAINLDFTYTNPVTKEVIQIKEDNGYEVYKMEGRRKWLNFLYDYVSNPLYYHPSSAKSTSHTDAQKKFVYGAAYKGTTADKQSAFLYDGIWWENEARANFNSLSGRGDKSYTYGTRNYRMMMMPIIDEHQMEQDRYIVSTADDLNICVKKQKDPEKLKCIKNFLTYLYSDAKLLDIDNTTNMLVPFNYEATKEQRAEMSVFGQNMRKIYESDKVQVFRRIVLDTYYKTSLREAYVDGKSVGYAVDAMLRGPGIVTKGNSTTIFDDTYTYFKNRWGDLR